MRMIKRFLTATAASAVLSATAFLGCDDPGALVAPKTATAGPSRAFSAWEPSALDTCTKAIHDQYSVVGDDGKLYPAWHPPVDPSNGCTFGHEHGRDPRGSDLFKDVGFIPFGRANEAANHSVPHPGFKIEWENDVDMEFVSDGLSSILTISCDVMFEVHQGSAGSGRFVQPQHEMAQHARCTDGTEIHVQFLAVVGRSGSFTQSCSGYKKVRVVVEAGRPGRSGPGRRFIPDRRCMEQYILKRPGGRSRYNRMHEIWQSSEVIRAENGRVLVSLDPYFKVLNPVRYYDPDSSTLLANSVELCDVTPEGLSAQGGPCDELDGATGVAWNDPASPFDGAHREVKINTIRVRNAEGPEVWYTDAWGGNGSPEPFPGSLRQWISTIDNEVATPIGGNIGRDRDYGGNGVHAPN